MKSLIIWARLSWHRPLPLWILCRLYMPVTLFSCSLSSYSHVCTSQSTHTLLQFRWLFLTLYFWKWHLLKCWIEFNGYFLTSEAIGVFQKHIVLRSSDVAKTECWIWECEEEKEGTHWSQKNFHGYNPKRLSMVLLLDTFLNWVVV